MAPQIDYTQHIFIPFLYRHLGIEPTLHVEKRGYFPRGGGKVICSIPPINGPIPPVSLLERGAVTSIRGQAHVGGLPKHLAHKMRDGARDRLIVAGYNPEIIEIDSVREKDEVAVASGGGIIIWAETSEGCRIAGTAVSSKGKDATDVGKEAAEELIQNLEHGGCVDEYLQVVNLLSPVSQMAHFLFRIDYRIKLSYSWLWQKALPLCVRGRLHYIRGTSIPQSKN